MTLQAKPVPLLESSSAHSALRLSSASSSNEALNSPYTLRVVVTYLDATHLDPHRAPDII